MARPRYPSDHRRWFRVMEDIIDDPKLAECPPAACWLYVLLLAVFNRMKIRGDTALIPARSLNALTGCDRTATDRLLSRLQTAGVLQFSRCGRSTSITLRNWLKHQGFTPAELQQESVETPRPTPTPTPTPTQARKARPGPPSRGRSRAPDALPPKDRERLIRLVGEKLPSWTLARITTEELETLSYWQSRGDLRADWVMTVFNRILSIAKREHGGELPDADAIRADKSERDKVREEILQAERQAAEDRPESDSKDPLADSDLPLLEGP